MGGEPRAEGRVNHTRVGSREAQSSDEDFKLLLERIRFPNIRFELKAIGDNIDSFEMGGSSPSSEEVQAVRARIKELSDSIARLQVVRSGVDYSLAIQAVKLLEVRIDEIMGRKEWVGRGVVAGDEFARWGDFVIDQGEGKHFDVQLLPIDKTLLLQVGVKSFVRVRRERWGATWEIVAVRQDHDVRVAKVGSTSRSGQLRYGSTAMIGKDEMPEVFQHDKTVSRKAVQLTFLEGDNELNVLNHSSTNQMPYMVY